MFTQEALKLNPDLADAYYNLGNIQRELSKSKEAELSLRRAIELDSTMGEAYFNLGLLLRANSKYDEAMYNFEKAKDNNMDANMCLAQVGHILLRQGNHDIGIKKIREGEGSIIFDLTSGFSTI